MQRLQNRKKSDEQMQYTFTMFLFWPAEAVSVRMMCEDEQSEAQLCMNEGTGARSYGFRATIGLTMQDCPRQAFLPDNTMFSHVCPAHV